MSTTSLSAGTPRNLAYSARALSDTLPDSSVPSLPGILQARREYVTRELENICQKFARPRILSVSNGRLREAESILPVCEQKSGEFVAFDQNTGTLAMLRQEYGSSIRCEQDLDPHGMGKFHHIYALNRLNEIHAPAARGLLTTLASMLHKGGSLLVSNFTPALQALGYMEGVLWNPIYRAEADMARLAEAISDRDMLGHVIWRDETDTVVYLEIQK